MPVWQAFILGILQGLTEFLPVSSSGHLALAQMIFDRYGAEFSQPGVVFDAMLHVGTAVAVVWAERQEIRRWLSTRAGFSMFLLLIVGTLSTAVFAFPLKDFAKGAFTRPVLVGLALLITGAIVLTSRFLKGGVIDQSTMRWRHAAVIGLVQGLAVFPGISRSGATITTGLATGLERAWAARFSFLLSVPAIAGATLVELISERDTLSAGGSSFWLAVAIGAIAACVSGYGALKLVIRMVSSQIFDRFAWYCIPLGAVVILVVTLS